MAVKFEYTGKLSNGRRWDLDSSKRITIEIDDNDLTIDELLDEFTNFLRALGYGLQPEDRLEIVNDFVSSDSSDVNQFNTSNTGEELIAPPHG